MGSLTRGNGGRNLSVTAALRLAAALPHVREPFSTTMTDPRYEAVDRLLDQVRSGDRDAFDEMLPMIYGELHQLARKRRRLWTGDETLNTTALVHEAYVRLAGQPEPAWRNLPHFLAVASRAMRQIQLDHAKRKHRAKRGGVQRRIPLHEIEGALTEGKDLGEAGAAAVIALDDALRRLEQHDSRQSRIVECRFFGGMTVDDTAVAMGVSPATVKRGRTMAQAWLYREMSRAAEGE